MTNQLIADCSTTELLPVVQFLVLERLRHVITSLASLLQANQHKHFNYFSRDYCNSYLVGSYPTAFIVTESNCAYPTPKPQIDTYAVPLHFFYKWWEDLNLIQWNCDVSQIRYVDLHHTHTKYRNRTYIAFPYAFTSLINAMCHTNWNRTKLALCYRNYKYIFILGYYVSITQIYLQMSANWIWTNNSANYSHIKSLRP